MKRLGKLVLLLGMLVILGLAATITAWGSVPKLPVPAAADQPGSGMPGWPVPDKPIPQHEPGRPSRAGNYRTQVTQINAAGVEEVFTLTGLEAMLADGAIPDPLAGGYRLVGKEDIVYGVFNRDDNFLDFKTYENPYVTEVTGSAIRLDEVDLHSLDITAGDLNGDGVDEQIAAWVDVGTKNIFLAIGEMEGTDGRSSSEPAAAADGENIDLLVRGYDQALWHAHYNGSAWGDWDNDGEGLLLSGPAMASRGSAAFDVFAVGFTDDEDFDDGIYTQVYQRHWDGAGWAGLWAGLPVDDLFTTAPTWMGSPPELDAPAAVASGTDVFDVFRVAPDRTLRWNHSDDDGLTWGGWQGLGGMLASGPGAVLLDDGRLQVFAVGVDQALWYLRSNGAGWENWQRVALDGMAEEGVTIASAPAAVALDSDQIDVYVRGSDDQLWSVHYNGSTWGNWSEGGGDLASRPAAAGSDLFALAPDGRMLHSIDDGNTWNDFANHSLPACCLGTPINTDIRAYVTAESNPMDQINVLDVETGHFLGDGRQQIALAYTWEDPAQAGRTGIGLQLFDVYDGFRTLDSLGKIVDSDHEEDYYPKIAVGEFDGDAPQEIALAYGTRRGGVRVYQNFDYAARQIAWLKAGHYDLYHDYPYGDDMHNEISSIEIADGWQACVRDHEGDNPVCITNSVPNLDTDPYYMHNKISYVDVTQVVTGTNIFVDVTDGINLQRNAYVALEIFDVDPQDPTPVLKAVDYFEMIFTDTDDYPAPERTLDIAAGDFDGTRNQDWQLNDEIALIWDKVCRGSSCHNYRAYFHILDVEPDVTGSVMTISAHSGRDLETKRWSLEMDCSVYPRSAEINLAVGDFDGDGLDEIARTWPNGFYDYYDPVCGEVTNQWPKMFRNLEVLYWDGGWETVSEEFSGASAYNYEDALAAGDLDLNLVDEIVHLDAEIDEIRIYSFTPGDGITGDPSNVEAISNGDHDVPILATGDFSGESVRVGPPSYRRQYDVGQVIAVVNAPPKHKDTINGELYNLNADDANTYSQFEQVVDKSTEVSVTTHKDWGVDSEFKLTFGAPEGTHVSTSLENSYGENFEHTASSTQSLTYQQTIGAVTDDVLYYTRLGYDVWEYPVYDRLTNAPQGYMSVVWPIGGMQSVVEGANSCDGWYMPNHQLMNVWSYPSRADQLIDRDESGDLYDLPVYEIGTSGIDFSVAFSKVEEQSRSHKYEMGFAASFETQIGGDEVGVNLGVVSFSTRLPSMFFSTRSEYNYSELSEWETKTTEDTKLSGYFARISDDNQYKYTVEPYIYWSQDDYLVLDYVTDPTDQSFWSSTGDNYNRPDPAFIFPWAESGSDCSHRWPDAKYFTSDIHIDPPMASAGDVVTITATIRNFSEIGNGSSPFNQPFKVSFYNGDPDSGGIWIGEYTIGVGGLMPRGAGVLLTPNIQWTAEGSGELHIYAVIDPQDSLVEVHDENDTINNNKGYGVLTMDTIEFIDVGQAAEKAYQDITFQMGVPSLSSALYVPLANWTENLRIDMLAADQFNIINSLGTPFEIAAYQEGWEEPESNFSFVPQDGDPPAVILVDYAGADLAGFQEDLLTLYRYTGVDWQPANLDCGVDGLGVPLYPVLRLPQDGLLAVPICQTGTFALSDQQPIMQSTIYLPLSLK